MSSQLSSLCRALIFHVSVILFSDALARSTAWVAREPGSIAQTIADHALPVQALQGCISRSQQFCSRERLRSQDDADVGVGDIVFCQVNPTKQYFAHAVMEKTWCPEVLGKRLVLDCEHLWEAQASCPRPCTGAVRLRQPRT